MRHVRPSPGCRRGSVGGRRPVRRRACRPRAVRDDVARPTRKAPCAGGWTWSSTASPPASRTTGVPPPRRACRAPDTRCTAASAPDRTPPTSGWAPATADARRTLVRRLRRGLLLIDFCQTRVLDPRASWSPGSPGTRPGWSRTARSSPGPRPRVHPVLRGGARTGCRDGGRLRQRRAARPPRRRPVHGSERRAGPLARARQRRLTSGGRRASRPGATLALAACPAPWAAAGAAHRLSGSRRCPPR